MFELHFTVSDSGITVPAHLLNRLFSHAGGLAILKQLCEADQRLRVG
jgi:hypothetical protein